MVQILKGNMPCHIKDILYAYPPRLCKTSHIVLVYFRLIHNQVIIYLSLRSHGEKVSAKTWFYNLENF